LSVNKRAIGCLMLKLWVGGILDAEIGDSFRLLRNALEARINAALQGQDYGDALGTWDVILVVSSQPPAEYVRYSKRTKETDVRLVVNYDDFVQASGNERADLLAGALLKSLHRLRGKHIDGVDFDRLEHDVSGALAKV
jgi:hypothetical protein